MLQYIKKYMKGWFLGIILFFIFISFTFWGVGDIFRSGGAHLIKVGDYKITRDIFFREFDSNVRYLKKDKELSKIELENVAYETLNNIKDRYLILNAAKRININISEKILKEKIYGNPLFKDKVSDKFDKNIYLNFINRNFGSEKAYLDYLKTQIIIELFSNYFENQLDYPKNLTNKIYNKLEETKSFKIASIDKNSEKKLIKNAKEETLLKYFNKNKKKYLFDERRSFSYIFIDIHNVKKKIEISESEILDYYNNQKNDFTEPEKRKIDQLVFNNEELAKETLNIIKKESNFQKIADNNKEEISYVSLGLVEKEQLFDEFILVFNLKKNEFSKLIKTDIGWHILRVTEIIEEKIKELDQVKEKIKEDIALDKSYDELDLVLKNVEDEITNGSNLEDISNKLSLNLKKIHLLEKKIFFNSQLPEEIKINNFYNEIFEGELDSDLFIEETENGFYVVRVDKIVDEQQKTFEEAYNDVISNIKDEEVDNKTKNKIKMFRKKLTKGVSFMKISDSLNMSSRTTKSINRESIINQGITPEFAKKLFESKKDSINDNETNDKHFIVQTLTESEVKFNDEKFNDVEKSITKVYGIDNFQQITKILEKKFPISVNKRLLSEFVDRLQY